MVSVCLPSPGARTDEPKEPDAPPPENPEEPPPFWTDLPSRMISSVSRLHHHPPPDGAAPRWCAEKTTGSPARTFGRTLSSTKRIWSRNVFFCASESQSFFAQSPRKSI